MLIQFLVGLALILFTIMLSGGGLWFLEIGLARRRAWLLKPPHRPKLILTLCVLAVWIMLQFTIAVWVWALTFLGLGLFDGIEPAVYFSLVAFTTLGFGDILLPDEWRLLSGLAAANGLMHFGLMTAVLIEGIRQVRLGQIAAQDAEE